MIATGQNHTEATTSARRWRVPPRFLRRYRIVPGLVVLIGITTPQAMSAPRSEPAVSPATVVRLSTPIISDPAATLLLGAAMLGAAAILRRSERTRS